MGLLVGLPLKLFYLLFLALRFLWPVALFILVRWVLRKMRNTRWEPRQEPRQERSKEPDFDGPVYTVDYEEVPEDET